MSPDHLLHQHSATLSMYREKGREREREGGGAREMNERGREGERERWGGRAGEKDRVR